MAAKWESHTSKGERLPAKKKTAKANPYENVLRIRDTGKPTKTLYAVSPQQVDYRAPKVGKTGYYNQRAKDVNNFMNEYMNIKNSAPKKKKAKVVVNNHMKAYGQMDPKTNVVEINKKKHKGDKTELADTIHHELLHVKHPNMKEREVKDKATREVDQMSQSEKDRLIAKVRMKGINQRRGALKRKYKMSASEDAPGAIISKFNDLPRKERVSVMGLV